MEGRVNEATAQFLRAAADDLQRQMSIAGARVAEPMLATAYRAVLEG